jgi:hypothetical protein
VQVRCIGLERGTLEEALAECRAQRQLRLLFDESDPQAIAALDFAVIELREPGYDSQKRGFSSPIAANEANPLAGTHRQLCTIKERAVAKREMRIKESDE